MTSPTPSPTPGGAAADNNNDSFIKEENNNNKRKRVVDYDEAEEAAAAVANATSQQEQLDNAMANNDGASNDGASNDGDGDNTTPQNSNKARTIRLEQNRKAARESRKRKKMMIEELQRSVIFFSRANGTLKQQNDELTRCLMQAQAQVAAIEQGQAPKAAMPAPQPIPQQFNATSQAQAQAVATQAIYESQGFPPAAARAAAQTMNAGCAAAPTPAGTQQTPTAHHQVAAPVQPPQQPLQAMPTGATMQAMANFQQAAAAAMQAAMGMNPTTKVAAPEPPTYAAPHAVNPAQYMTWQYPTQPTYTTAEQQQAS